MLNEKKQIHAVKHVNLEEACDRTTEIYGVVIAYVIISNNTIIR